MYQAEWLHCNGYLLCDKELITRVIINLISNAIKHSPFNEVIKLECRSIEGQVEIRIIDKGGGIESKDINHVFKKYYSVKNVNYQGYTSSGLGLTFCKLAIEAHCGFIKIETSNANGTTIKFKLPGYSGTRCEIKREYFVNNRINLTCSEKNHVKGLCLVLKSLPIYRISEIIENIHSINAMPGSNLEKWKEVLSEVVFAGNETLYELIINKIIDEKL